MAKKIGVLLAGCGVNDGSEIHEATLALLALDEAGAEAVCMAPDVGQPDVIDHVTGKPLAEQRNALVEAARIARGKIRNIASVSAKDLDGLVVPGGYGAAKILCDFAARGENAKPHPEVERLVRELHAAAKPMAFFCIAPALAAAIFHSMGIQATLTIGNDEATAAKLMTMGMKHESQPVEGVCVDRRNRIVSTPCYMLARGIREVRIGAERAVRALLEMA